MARVAVGGLEAAGLIRDRGGRLAFVDRRGLEAASCECYGFLRDQLVRIVRGWPSQLLTKAEPPPG